MREIWDLTGVQLGDEEEEKIKDHSNLFKIGENCGINKQEKGNLGKQTNCKY